MQIAIFAKKTFQVSSRKVYTFDEFATGSTLQTEKQDVAGKKPSTYIKGSDLDSMSFNISLNRSLGMNVRAEYESWKALEESKVPYPFILGGRPFGPNKWLLTSVNLNGVKIDGKGEIVSGVLQLQFEEYVRPGSAQASGTKSGGKAPAVKNGSEKDIGILLNTNTDKSTQKRSNPSAKVAVSSGLKVWENKQREIT